MMKKEMLKKVVEGMKLAAYISVGCMVAYAVEKAFDKVRNQKSKKEQAIDDVDDFETEKSVEGKKYILTELDVLHGKPLYRIRALKDFGDVRRGDLGGFVKSEKNLSQEGNCWIYDDAMVLDNAFVSGDARIRDTAVVKDNAEVSGNSVIKQCAKVFGNAKIDGNVSVSDNASVYGYASLYAPLIGNGLHVEGYSQVSGKARIFGESLILENSRVTDNAYIRDSLIRGDSMVYGNASLTNTHICHNVHVYGNARIFDNVNLRGNARVYENAKIIGECVIGDNAVITTPNDYITVNGIYKSRIHCLGTSDTFSKPVTFYHGTDEKVYVSVELFNCTLDEFVSYVQSTMKLTPESKEMLIDAVDFVNRYFHLSNKDVSTEDTETDTKDSAE